ncbi:hypothetical protein O181_102742 [Austropuccinia psidii MF-1]|uniref:Integrase catalytic domain-containing protein n=1 Tax=Austropuccinia psidii MF-1 TaxID=1389203 RepID=A0A9Q3JJR5_9BASI|nr:hypothetical protein [Austropuccinia psidii MF-1]
MWKKGVGGYSKTCYTFKKANKYTCKRLGHIIKIQEPSRPWEAIHMDWVTGLSPEGDRSYNPCLVIVDWFALWKNPHQLFGAKLSFSTAYHPQTDGLAERMIQTLEEMVRRFCAYGLELKDFGKRMESQTTPGFG